MNPPNFVQVSTALGAAVVACEQRPATSSSRIYLGRLSTVRDTFADATRQTDANYTEWRRAVGRELLQFRKIRVELDRIAELADEHGYDDVPRRRIVYTERDALLGLVDEVVGFLDAHQTEWDWLVPAAKRLRELVSEAKAAKLESEKLFTVYTIAVKERVAAYTAAVSLLREFARDARSELGSADAFEKARLDNY